MESENCEMTTICYTKTKGTTNITGLSAYNSLYTLTEPFENYRKNMQS